MSGPSRAEEQAMEVLEAFGNSGPPVAVEKIALAQGAQITYETFDGQVSGMLIRDEDRAIIGVNSTHAPVRQRFTIAHEIGHLVMHKGRPVFIDRLVRINERDGSSDKDERQANAFAAALLMPHTFVTAEIERIFGKRSQTMPEQLVDELAAKFDVSSAAMGYRLVNLNILDFYPGH
jgi:Zn-dependent peptidase ImmA (M78 family)